MSDATQVAGGQEEEGQQQQQEEAAEEVLEPLQQLLKICGQEVGSPCWAVVADLACPCEHACYCISCVPQYAPPRSSQCP